MKTFKKIPEFMTEQELLKILEVSSPKHKIAFALGFYCCMRVSEVVKLKQENINRNTKLILIKQAKGNKDRNIPYPPVVEKGLKNIPINIGVRALQISFKNKCKEILNRDLHFHSLRHSGITHYLTKENWNSLRVQQMAGHSRITTTELYSHVNPSDLVKLMWDKVPPQ